MELAQLSAKELRELLDKGEASPLEAIESYIRRIESVERFIGAYLAQTLDEALKKAKSLTDENNPNSSVWGLPYALSDNICTKDILTTASSKFLENFVPVYSADAYEKLAESGAILLGKTGLDEFGMGESGCYSALGSVNNPYDSSKIPGGSASGAAAAVASSEASFSLGVDTAGSVRIPASFCGVTAFKPTYGLLSRYGIIAHSSSIDQVGVIGEGIADCALVMQAISGCDSRDSTSLRIDPMDWLQFSSGSIQGMRIGFDASAAHSAGEESRRAYESAIQAFRHLGAEIIELRLEGNIYALAASQIISCAEASSNLARFDGVRFGVRVAADSADGTVIASRTHGFGEEAKNRLLFGTFAQTEDNYGKYYEKALKARQLAKSSYESLMQQCDAFLAPTAPFAPLGRHEAIEPFSLNINTAMASLAGAPAVSFPAGIDSDGMPIGMHLSAKSLGERELFTAVSAFQESTGYHKNKPAIPRQV
ncbi:MAG: amidase family protein [Eubacteriaceae bacterium]|nr:amidase family protein [Eubacteriaceae bacterium]